VTRCPIWRAKPEEAVHRDVDYKKKDIKNIGQQISDLTASSETRHYHCYTSGFPSRLLCIVNGWNVPPVISSVGHGCNVRQLIHIIPYSSPHTHHLTLIYVHSSMNAAKDAAPSTATTLSTKLCTPEVALAVAALPVAVDEALVLEVPDVKP
jgi:hypothetical protein